MKLLEHPHVASWRRNLEAMQRTGLIGRFTHPKWTPTGIKYTVEILGPWR